jgi:hypothetical protein
LIYVNDNSVAVAIDGQPSHSDVFAIISDTGGMSALGRKKNIALRSVMSALPPKAKGKTAIAVPSLDKLPSVIDTLISAIEA